MSFFKKLRDRMFRSSDKIGEGLEALVTGSDTGEAGHGAEGAPAAGTAEIIVDITTTGSTLSSNRLKILDDGVILRSSAVFAACTSILPDIRAAEFQANLKKPK